MAKPTAKTAEKDRTKDQGEQAPEVPAPRSPILQPDMTAESFSEQYPGTIRYPAVFSLKMHKRYYKLVTESSEDDEDSEPVVLIDNKGGLYVFTIRNIRLALEFATIDIQDATGDKPKPIEIDPDKLEELPLEVAALLGITAGEYLNRRVRFPRLSS